LLEHYNINVNGPLALFQATLPLLNSAKQPKIVTIGSSAGSVGGMEKRPMPNTTYGTSKAALHYLTRKMHFEHENLIAFPIDPGYVLSPFPKKCAVSLHYLSPVSEFCTSLNLAINAG